MDWDLFVFRHYINLFNFYRKRIFNLFKEIFSNNLPNNLSPDVKYAYDTFIKSIDIIVLRAKQLKINLKDKSFKTSAYILRLF